jgi:hypothetical protein
VCVKLKCHPHFNKFRDSVLNETAQTSMNRIEQALFRNFITDYGGAFFIDRNIDLFVKNVVITNIKTASYCRNSVGNNVGGPGFAFAGNSFSGSDLCCSILSTQYTSLLYMYSATCVLHLNDTSVDNGTCCDYSVVLGKGKSFVKSLNCTHLKTTSYISALHFGWWTVSYYCTDIIVANNNGKTIFGHTCSDKTEQTSNNILLLDNNSTEGLFMFWTHAHRITNSYMIGNVLNKVFKYQECTVTFDSCYHDGVSNIDTQTNIRTRYEIFITISSQNCLTFALHSCVLRKSCQYRENSLICLFIMVFLIS